MKNFKEICESIQFLKGLRDKEYEELEPLFEIRKLKKNTIIFHGGEKDLCLYIIIKGRVKIFKQLPEENTTIDIAGIGHGECFGEMAFVDSMPRSASAITLTDSEIYTMSQDNFMKFREIHPIAGHKIESGMLRMTIQRLRKTSERFSYQALFGDFMKDALHKKHDDLAKAHAQAMAANSFLFGVLNTSPDIIIFIDNDNKITLFNKGAETITGYTEEEVKGKIIDMIFPSTFIENIREDLKTKKQITNHEIGILRKNNEIIPAMISAAVMFQKNKNIGAVITGQDITLKKELEDKIMENEKLSLLGQLAGEIVHEIKNPVHNIMLATSYMRATLLGTLNAQVDNSIKTVDIQLDRINQIIKNILLFINPTEEEKNIINLYELINSSVNLIKTEIDEKNISINYENINRDIEIYGNSHQLIQLFINLFNNAANHMNENGKIQVDVESMDNHINISIKDDGCGFREDNLPHIFKPFYTTRKKQGGSGLGLTICKKIVESNNGMISAENWENGGNITIELPIINKHEKESSKG